MQQTSTTDSWSWLLECKVLGYCPHYGWQTVVWSSGSIWQSAGGGWVTCCMLLGSELAVTTRVKTIWKKFRELLLVLTSHHISWMPCIHVYSSWMQTVMLHASEIGSLVNPNPLPLQRNDRYMKDISVVPIKPEDVTNVRWRDQLIKNELEYLDIILKEKRLCWYGHVELSSGVVRAVCDKQLLECVGRETQDDKKEFDRELLPWLEVARSRPP